MYNRKLDLPRPGEKDEKKLFFVTLARPLQVRTKHCITHQHTMKKPVKDTVKRLKEIITVEPLLACYQMALFISKPALDNLEFEKACRLVVIFYF